MTKQELLELAALYREISRQEKKLGKLEKSRFSESADQTAVNQRRQEIERLREKMGQNVLRFQQESARLRQYADGCTDRLMRQILILRYADGCSWEQVAAGIGGDNTPEGIRMIHNRYLASQ